MIPTVNNGIASWGLRGLLVVCSLWAVASAWKLLRATVLGLAYGVRVRKKYSPPHGNLRASRSNASSDSQECKSQEPLRMLKVMYLV